MSLLTSLIRTAIFDICLDAFFGNVKRNLSVLETLVLKKGDHFSVVKTHLSEVADFTNVTILEVASTYVMFEGDSAFHGRDVTGVIESTSHQDLMDTLNRWDFIP